MKRHVPILCAAVLSLLLGGCGITLIDAQPPASIYDLSAPAIEGGGETVTWQLVVEEPGAVRALGTNRITLYRSGNEIQYFKGARWSDRGPRLIQSRIIETLEATGRIVSVGRETSGIHADYRLKTELRDFQAVYDKSGAPRIVVTLSAKLFDTKSRRVVAARVFTASERAGSSRLDAIVRSFDSVLGQVTVEVSDWALVSGDAVG